MSLSRRKVNSLLVKLLKKGILFLRFQLFMTAVSWPFLIGAGIPLSKATLLGNALFGPFFILFLGLSTCIGISEFLSIPSTVFTFPLEYLTTAFMTFLSWGDRLWLFALPHDGSLVYFLFPISIIAGLHTKFLKSPLKMSIWLLMLMALFSYRSHSTIPHEECTILVPCYKKELILHYCQKYAFLFNPGNLGRTQGAASWVIFTLIPFLTKRGISQLTSYLCAQPSATSFLAAAALLEAIPVTFLYIPEWTGKLTNRGWSAWEKLCATLEETGTTLILLKQGETIKLQQSLWFLHASQKLSIKNGCRYPQLSLSKSSAQL